MDQKQIQFISKARMDMYDSIRAFFRDRGYVEVETPLLVSSPGMEPNLDPFEAVSPSFSRRWRDPASGGGGI